MARTFLNALSNKGDEDEFKKNTGLTSIIIQEKEKEAGKSS